MVSEVNKIQSVDNVHLLNSYQKPQSRFNKGRRREGSRQEDLGQLFFYYTSPLVLYDLFLTTLVTFIEY